MGDPKKLRKNYETPSNPWQKDRILDEKKLAQEYGLKNKREIWKAQTRIRDIRMRARHLLGYRGEDKDIRSKELLDKLYKIGIIPEGATLDDVLSLSTKNWLERRLQTLVFKKGLARTIKQARQFIVHRLISVDGRVVSVPGYIVTREQEDKISYSKGKPAILEEAKPEEGSENA